MASGLTRCGSCGAPLRVGAPACAYCGAAVPGAAAAPPPPPEEISLAIAGLRGRMADPRGLLAHLARALAGLGPGTVRPRRSLFGSGISRLHLVLGAIHYDLWREGAGCVVERQAVAAGMAVGMKDRVPASRWPELLVLDVARVCDEKGLGWQAVGRLLA